MNKNTVLILFGLTGGLCFFLLILCIIFACILKSKKMNVFAIDQERKKGRLFWKKISSPLPTVTVPVQLSVSEFTTNFVQKTRDQELGRKRAETLRETTSFDFSEYLLPKPRRVLSESEINPEDEVIGQRKVLPDKVEKKSLVGAMRRRSRSISLSYPISSSLRVSGMIDFMVFYDSGLKELEITVTQLFDIDLSAQNCVGLLGVASLTDHGFGFNKDDVYIIRAEDGSLVIVNQNLIGLSVSFVVYPKGAFMKRTQIKYGSDSPSFHESFRSFGFQENQLPESVIRLQVLAHFHEKVGMFSIGEVAYPLRKLITDQRMSVQEHLEPALNDIQFEVSLREDRYRGELGVMVEYDALGNRLSVSVVSATNLPRSHGLPSCSVKTMLFFSGHRMAKEKSKIVRKSEAPKFNSNHTFDLAKDKLCNVDLVLEVRHHGPINKSAIGYVHIGHEAEESGNTQWKELLSFDSLNKTVWHSIKRRKPNFC